MQLRKALVRLGFAGAVTFMPGCDEKKCARSERFPKYHIITHLPPLKISPQISKKELAKRNPNSEFTLQEGEDTSHKYNFTPGTRTEYAVLMDGTQIGTITAIRDMRIGIDLRLSYNGRVPGYTNSGIANDNEVNKKFGRESENRPVDFVGLAYSADCFILASENIDPEERDAFNNCPSRRRAY